MIKPIRVLLLYDIPESAEQAFLEAGYEVEHIKEPITEAALVTKLANVHIIGLSSSGTPIPLTEEILRASHRLLAIACFGIRTQDVDMKTCNAMGTAVFNSPYGDAASIAELIIGLLIGLTRELGERALEVHKGIWRKKSSGCHEIRGKTLGILDYGHVGSFVSVLAEGIGMKVIWYDERPLMPIGLSESRSTVEEVLQEADFVTLCANENPESSIFIGTEHFAIMKRGAYFLNFGSGTAVDLSALARSLDQGHLSGAVIDVFPEEPTDSFHKSWSSVLGPCKNVILTPHIGDSTIEGRKRVGIEVATHVIRYVNEGSTIGCVNLPAIDMGPMRPNSRRIINIHKNVRGVVQEIDFIVSSVNIGKQMIDTSGDMGYIMIDIDTKEITADIVAGLAAMGNTIRTRIV